MSLNIRQWAQSADKHLADNTVFSNNRFLGKMLGLHDERDEWMGRLTRYCEGKTPTAERKFLEKYVFSLIPFKNTFGKMVNKFTSLKMVHGLTGATKMGFIISGVFGGLLAGKNIIQGAMETQGGIVDKLIGGIKAGFNSVVKTVASIGAGIGAAWIPTALLGVSAMGPLAFLLGIFTTMFADGLVEKFIGHLFPTPGTSEWRQQSDLTGGIGMENSSMDPQVNNAFAFTQKLYGQAKAGNGGFPNMMEVYTGSPSGGAFHS